MSRSFQLLTVLFITLATEASSEIGLKWREYESGRFELDLVNRGDKTVSIYSAIINRRTDNAECVLIPVSSEYGVSLIRSDINLEAEGWGRSYIEKVDLDFADKIVAVIIPNCGELLEVEVLTSDGKITYHF